MEWRCVGENGVETCRENGVETCRENGVETCRGEWSGDV